MKLVIWRDQKEVMNQEDRNEVVADESGNDSRDSDLQKLED